MSTRMKIALAVSLILNVFLVGIAVGVFVTGARIAPAQAQRKPAPNMWLAAEALPPAQRTAFRQMLRDRAAEVQPELKSVRLARREAVALISQPNYDPTAVEEALQRARAGEMHARGEIDQAFTEYLARLTPQQRAAESMVRNRPGQLRAAVAEAGGAGAGRQGN
jgi:uncharacterized membrane protein